MTGHTPWAQIKFKMKDWEDFLNERMRREDEAVKLKFSYYASLGRGHMRHDLIKGWRDEDSFDKKKR
jgi:hypothetical protein